LVAVSQVGGGTGNHVVGFGIGIAKNLPDNENICLSAGRQDYSVNSTA
jgi:hypothetical protein